MDVERDRVLSTVSDRYTLVTNEEVFDLLRPVAQGFFGGGGLDDFECFNIHKPQSRASCRIDLTRKNPAANLFALKGGDQWTPFIRMSNSYNRTSRLEIQIGYCRWICLNGVIFGNRSYAVALKHDELWLGDPSFGKRIAREALRALGGSASAQKDFADSVERLRELPMTWDQTEMLFWRVWGVQLPSGGFAGLPPRRRERLWTQRQRFAELAESYREELSDTAYAAFNVLTDFASYPDGGQQHSVLTPSCQRKTGAWLSEILPLAAAPDFSFEGYFTDQDRATLAEFKEAERRVLF